MTDEVLHNGVPKGSRKYLYTGAPEAITGLITAMCAGHEYHADNGSITARPDAVFEISGVHHEGSEIVATEIHVIEEAELYAPEESGVSQADESAVAEAPKAPSQTRREWLEAGHFDYTVCTDCLAAWLNRDEGPGAGRAVHVIEDGSALCEIGWCRVDEADGVVITVAGGVIQYVDFKGTDSDHIDVLDFDVDGHSERRDGALCRCAMSDARQPHHHSRYERGDA